MSNLVNINVSVPEEHVAAVYTYVADLINGTEPAATSNSSTSETPLPKGAKRAPNGFGAATVKKNYLGGKSDYWRPFLEVLAHKPDEWVEWEDLCQAIGLTAQQTAGMLGAAERRCKLKPPYWKAYEDGTYWFQMTKTVAEQIQELASDAS